MMLTVKQPWDSGKQYDMMEYDGYFLSDANGLSIDTRWCPPSDVCWFKIPLTIE